MTEANLSLPYTFDTTMNGRWVLIGLWGAVPMLAVAYTFICLFVETMTPDDLMLIGLALVVMAAFDIFMGYLLFRKGQGAKGTISTHMVEVTADRFLGLHSSSPEGTFTLQQFEGISLQQTSVKGVRLGLVSLMGKNNTHTIKIAHIPTDKAEALAAFLSKELNLPRDKS